MEEMKRTRRDVIGTDRLLIIVVLLLLLCYLVIMKKKKKIINEIYWVKGKVGRRRLLKNKNVAEVMGWKL
jgi:cell division protein ZapA (FtsZ GTPase activity inhibitor)